MISLDCLNKMANYIILFQTISLDLTKSSQVRKVGDWSNSLYWLIFSHLYIYIIRENDGVLLTGWGSNTKQGNFIPKLQQARLIIEPQTLCNTRYEQVHRANPISLQIKTALPDLFQPNLLCAGSEVHLKMKGIQHTRIKYSYFLFYFRLVQVPV